MKFKSFTLSLVAAMATFSCTQKKEVAELAKEAPKTEVTANAATTAVASEYERGKKVYRSQCIACHAFDPRKIGSSGPEVFGSSSELLSARILTLDYPKGYKPKRNTRIMMKLPHLKDEISALTVYLNSPNPMQ